MQEEINQKTVALVIRAVRLDSDILRKAVRMYLDYRKSARAQGRQRHGRVSVKKLMGMDQGSKSIEVNAKGIKGFMRHARKYNVDFAIKKEKGGDVPKYTVFFKGRDETAIAAAFKDFAGAGKGRDRPSLLQRLKVLREKAAEINADRERQKEKSRDKEQSL